jgi:hypothetical protein
MIAELILLPALLFWQGPQRKPTVPDTSECKTEAALSASASQRS